MSLFTVVKSALLFQMIILIHTCENISHMFFFYCVQYITFFVSVQNTILILCGSASWQHSGIFCFLFCFLFCAGEATKKKKQNITTAHSTREIQNLFAYSISRNIVLVCVTQQLILGLIYFTNSKLSKIFIKNLYLCV